VPQPCTPWVTGDDVADCCSVETSSGVIFDEVAEQASELLFELSGRLYPGECEKTVRPACDSCYCGYQVLSRGHVIGPWDYGYASWGLCDMCLVACAPSRIKLSGYPVREISEVLIDGDILDPSLYRVWKSRYVTRLDGGRWPIQQNLTLDDSEDNTFAISYTYGADPPATGVMAAAQLACELYKACSEATSGDCVLPVGVQRVTRQGIVIEKQAFTSWGYIGKNNRGFAPGWKTGLPLVDSFLNAYNRSGLMRRPTFWSPGRRQYAQEWG
jgi:hypothetical protein